MIEPRSVTGRDEEVGVLDDLVLGRMGPRVAILDGEAGIGKSTLWRHALHTALADGQRVLIARPAAAEAGLSYAALADLLRPLGDLPDVLPAPRRAALAGALLIDGGEAAVVEPVAVALGLHALLEILARRGPVLVAVDDWQWLDPASAAVVAYAARRLPDGVRMVSTLRSGEPDRGLFDVAGSLGAGDAVVMTLGPLPAAALGSVIRDIMGRSLSAPALEALHAAARGNPLAALEAVRAQAAPTRSVDTRRLLAERAMALPASARAVLRAVAAVGAPPEALVEQLAGEGLESALASGLVQRDAGHLRLFHPLLASVVEARTPAGQWRELHRRIAAITTDAEQRARHLAAATVGPNASVAAELEAASRRALERGAPASAAELAEIAARMSPEDEAEVRVSRSLAAADAWWLAGDGARAEAVLRPLIEELLPGSRRSRALHRLAVVTPSRDALPLARQALEEAGADAECRVASHLAIAALLFNSGHADGSYAHARAAVTESEQLEDPYLRSRALVESALQAFDRGGGVQEQTLREAAALEQLSSGRPIDMAAMAVLGMQLYTTGELTEGRRLLEAELAENMSRGHLNRAVYALTSLARLEVRAGRPRLAQAHATRALEHAIGAGLSNAELASRSACALVHAVLGDALVAHEHAQRGIDMAEDDLVLGIGCRRALGLLALSEGDGDEALRWLVDIPAMIERLAIGEPWAFCAEQDLGEALVLTGDLAGARAVQERLEATSRRLGRRPALGGALRVRGLIASAQGRHADALGDLDESVATLDGLGHPLESARSLLARGIVQRRAKRRAEARASFQAARAIFAQIGAVLWADRASSEERRLGGRRATSRDELTATERRIAELAADGRSNREIAAELYVTERTVEANLTRVYRKLGLRSRTQLARLPRTGEANDAGSPLSTTGPQA